MLSRIKHRKIICRYFVDKKHFLYILFYMKLKKAPGSCTVENNMFNVPHSQFEEPY